ncbi:DUF3990 domain-containing protein [Lederbergia panacisoli]|uniref:DUF3990 domain-containing protein n=1 Tax=Lederbergia panacisoli TaxID=1255251 RepID=UPI00214C5E48|nr:DUF3990 domain-containing protein [Lederbergia panacisoli]MCR2823786.1 DUF3990 domain-containing protein [Lederbergia panacisoli]
MLKDYINCYHGTIKVHSEYITLNGITFNKSRYATDFGKGFYLTNNESQAIDWAKRKSKHHFGNGSTDDATPVIIHFNIDITKLGKLKHCFFEEPNLDWSNFILECRKKGLEVGLYHDFHFVLGSLADGKIMPLVRRAIGGRINNMEFLDGIRPTSSANTQLSLHTDAALKCITLMEVREIEV